MKAAAKKANTNFRRSQRKTGGGPPDNPIDEEAEKVLSLIQDQMIELHNEFDSDRTIDVSALIVYTFYHNIVDCAVDFNYMQQFWAA